MSLTLYIAGPMRGIRLYNFPAFDEARDRLRELGHRALSPADMDREIGMEPLSLPPDHDWTRAPEGFSLVDALSRDEEAIVNADGVLLLDGYERSTGARREALTAIYLGKRLFRFARTSETPRLVELGRGLVERAIARTML